MYRSLREYVAALEGAGELARVRALVSPLLEITAIADRESKSRAPHAPTAAARRNDPRFATTGGRALLFESVEGSTLPVLINAFGSYRRLEMALGCNEAGEGVAAGHTASGFDGLAAVIGALVKPDPPGSLAEAARALKRFAPLLRIPPRAVSAGACQELVTTGDRIDLRRLPLVRCWPLDGDLASVGYPASVNDGVQDAELTRDPAWRGRYITFAGVHTIHADDAGAAKPKSHNIGMYRVQLAGRRTLAMHWHVHHDGARHWRSWKRRGERMPVAIVFGGESVLPFASIAPLPPGISELLMAGFLNRGGIPLVRCRTVPLRVPANAEIVIEGWVSDRAGPPGFDPRAPDAGELGPGAFFEGPFGDHTGFYSLPDRYPLVEVTAITTRRDAIFPATVVGLPPQEDYYLGKATERIFLPLLKTLIHDVADYDLPLFGAFHNCAFVKIRKEYALQARRVMHAIWGAGQMAWTKTIVVVDDDVDVHDLRAVLDAVSERCDPARDVEVVRGPLDILDHAAPRMGAGSKIGFDATRRIAGEEAGGGTIGGPATAPDAASREAGLRAARGVAGVLDAAYADGRAGWLVVSVERRVAGDGRRAVGAVMEALARLGPRGVGRLVIGVGPDVNVHDADEALFHWCANCDPGRDAVRRAGRLGFDATPKTAADGDGAEPVRDWPPLIRMSEEMTRRVAERWEEYGLAGAAERRSDGATKGIVRV